MRKDWCPHLPRNKLFSIWQVSKLWMSDNDFARCFVASFRCLKIGRPIKLSQENRRIFWNNLAPASLSTSSSSLSFISFHMYKILLNTKEIEQTFEFLWNLSVAWNQKTFKLNRWSKITSLITAVVWCSAVKRCMWFYI